VSDAQGRFGAQASAYHAFRPRWPGEVFRRVLAAVPGPRTRAVDLGAGTGIVAWALAEHFDEVVAVEPDARMLAQLEPHARIRMQHARAEQAELEAHSVALVAAGNAFHWMEAERVLAQAWTWLRPGGALAVFRYDPPHAAHGVLARLLAHEYEVEWRAHVHPRLRDPDFTRRSVAASAFGATLVAAWIPNDLTLSLAELLGFLRSTSYAGGHARAQPDPEAYWRALEERIRAAAGPGPFVLDFRVELLLARREGA
jgi:trans-aconitate methyltransferase